jgi:hypothetical protein
MPRATAPIRALPFQPWRIWRATAQYDLFQGTGRLAQTVTVQSSALPAIRKINHRRVTEQVSVAAGVHKPQFQPCDPCQETNVRLWSDPAYR